MNNDKPATKEEIKAAEDAMADYMIDRAMKYHNTKSITYAVELANCMYDYLEFKGFVN